MKKWFSFLLLGCAVALGCSGAATNAPAVQPPSTTGAGATYTVVPPYHDPEYVVRLTLPEGTWFERHALDAGPGAPDTTLKLSRQSDGALIEVLFMPSQGHTVSEAADWLRTHFSKSDEGDYGNVVVEEQGNAAAFSASLHAADDATRIDRLVAYRVFRRDDMRKSIAVIRVTVPSGHDAVAMRDEICGKLTLLRTGPLSPRESLAQCMTDHGTVMYSTSWCGPCKLQLEQFREGESRINHVQCDDESTHMVLKVCNDLKLEGFPTWIFPNGSRSVGVTSLDELAEKSGCPKLPPEK